MNERALAEELQSVLSRVRDSSFDSFPYATQEAARHSFLDWIGCAVAGSVDASSAIVRQALHAQAGDRTVIGAGPVAWRDAVVLNGVHGHALDFDDMLPAVQGHPSAAIFPALLVLAEARDSTLAEMLTAYVVGVEVAAWIAQRIMPEHYDAGWHATGTVGAFAAASASAHLMKLDEQQLISVLDFAATQAAGLRELFGTVAKPLHAGRAAEAGLLAAFLAQAGGNSGGGGLSGAKGFIALHQTDKHDSNHLVENWAVEGTLYKTYASCYMTQAAIDAALSLRAQTDLEAIEKVVVSVSPKLSEVCAIIDPQTENEAKFSLHATVALALLGEDLSENRAFTPASLNSQEYRSMRDRISLHFDNEKSGHETRVDLQIQLDSGEILSSTCDRGVPEADVQLRGTGLSRKFESLASPVIGPNSVSEVLRKVLVTQGSVREITKFLGNSARN